MPARGGAARGQQRLAALVQRDAPQHVVEQVLRKGVIVQRLGVAFGALQHPRAPDERPPVLARQLCGRRAQGQFVVTRQCLVDAAGAAGQAGVEVQRPVHQVGRRGVVE